MTIVVAAVAAKVGGGATYVRELARELSKQASPDRFIFYVPADQADFARNLSKTVEWRVTSIGRAGVFRRLWWDQVTLRRIVRRERVDVLYSTGNFALLRCPCPQVLLVQNALYFSAVYRSRILPQLRWWVRLSFALRSWLARLSIRHADAVVVPSQALLEEIRASGATLPARALVNHYGTRLVEAKEGSASDESRPGFCFRLLYPAFYYEHKNMGTLFRALQRLREQGHVQVELITTADPSSPLSSSSRLSLAEKAQAQDSATAACVRFVRPQSMDQAVRLYRDCDALVYPTLVESFGHPLVEAMACGLPILASDIPVNRELAGDVPLYFDPFDPDDLADKIHRLSRDLVLRARLGAAARARAQPYTWSAHWARLRELLLAMRRDVSAR